MKRFWLLPMLLATQLGAQTPDWAQKVAPILYQNCTSCHVEGGIGPVSFVGYQAAKTYAYSIRGAAEQRVMPPWPADPNFRRYAHEKLLSAEEIQTIVDWVDGGMPSGDTSLAPPAPKPKAETSIVNPDLKLKMPDYVVSTVKDEYRCFVMPTGLLTDKFLTEIEVVPGNLSVVHHVLVFHDTSGVPLQLDNNDPKPGYLGFGGTGSPTSKMIGVWVPGQDPFRMPPGMGILLQKNGYIILQVHYPPNISNVTDSSKVYLKLSSSPLRQVGIEPALNHVAPSLQNGPLYIPANQKKSFIAKYTVPINISIFAVAPHMHLIGRSISAFGVSSAGDTSNYISIPAWDFHWQRTYSFRKVERVSAGTVLWGNASYDNTSANPSNPNSPPLAVSLGEGTGDEMMLIYFWYTLYQSGDENIVLDSAEPKNLTSVLLHGKKTDNIYPNPAEDHLFISEWQGNSGEVLCQVLSSDGRLIDACDFRLTNGGLDVDLREVPAGIYFLRVSDGNSMRVYRIMRR